MLATTEPVVGENQIGNVEIANNTLPPMVKLAMVCATKGDGSNDAKKKPDDTSSEGSSTEGGW